MSIERLPYPRVGARRERGVSLIFALIALGVIALATLGLLRSVDTGARILGNLGLKQDAVRYSDTVAEEAIAKIRTMTATQLESDGAGSLQGYYATSLDTLDPTGAHGSDTSRAVVDWDGDSCASMTSGTYASCKRAFTSTLTSSSGISAMYVITRLCTSSGSATSSGNNCAVPSTTSSGTSTVKGGLSYGDSLRASGTTGQYYRILVRTRGARNSVAYTETIVYF